MNNIDFFPKSIKKAVRYIKQEATKEQLEDIKKIIDTAIKIRYQREDKVKMLRIPNYSSQIKVEIRK